MIGSLADHLVHALTLHRKWCRQTGIPFPPLLDALLVEISASAGQAWPNLGGLEPAVDHLLMDYSTTALRLAVSERTVRRLIADGHLPAVRVAGRSLVRVADLESYVSELGGAA